MLRWSGIFPRTTKKIPPSPLDSGALRQEGLHPGRHPFEFWTKSFGYSPGGISRTARLHCLQADKKREKREAQRGRHGLRSGQGCDWKRMAVHGSIRPLCGANPGSPWQAVQGNSWGHWLRPSLEPIPVSRPPCSHLQQDKAHHPLPLWDGSHSQDCSQDSRTFLPYKLSKSALPSPALRHNDLRLKCDFRLENWEWGALLGPKV